MSLSSCVSVLVDVLSPTSLLEEFAKTYKLSKYDIKQPKTIFENFVTEFKNQSNNMSKICQYSHSNKCNNHKIFGNDIKSTQTILKNITPVNLKTINYDTKTQYVTIDKVSIGDVICISYYPDSQRYMDYYENIKRVGKVIFLDQKQDDLIIWSFDGLYSTFQSLVVEGCSYLGTSRGYNYIIEKYTS